jgi:hypothetical protein
MMLENKTAVIYGGGGAIGGAVARAFAGSTPAPTSVQTTGSSQETKGLSYESGRDP